MPPTEQHIAIANERMATLRKVDEKKAQLGSDAKACKALGLPQGTVSKWRKAHAKHGFEGLIPKFDQRGRDPLYVLNEVEDQSLKAIYVATERTSGAGSKTMAARLFAQSERCSPELRAAIMKKRSSKHKLTSIIRRAMDVPEAVITEHRTPSKSLSRHYTTMRTNTYIDEGGVQRNMHVGALDEWDDATVNFYFCVPWPHGGDACSRKYGVRVGRFQFIPSIDVGTLVVPSFSVIARPHEAYRATDLLGAMGQKYTDVGIPLATRIERGVWEAEAVKTALNTAGTRVFHAYSSNGKPYIENLFSRLWTPMSLIPGHAGRTRASHEVVARLAMRCQQGLEDPRKHFLMIHDAMSRIEATVDFINHEPVESKFRGTWVPAERWAEEIGQYPMRQLTADQRWLYSRERRQWTARKCLVGGSVETPAGKIPMFFRHPELMNFERCKVNVYFDPFLEDAPARLILAERCGDYPAGHIIGDTIAVATMGEVPQFWLTEEGWDKSTVEAAALSRRQMAHAVHTEYRTLGLSHGRMVPRGLAIDAIAAPLPKPQQPAPAPRASVSERRTERGEVIRIERNTASPRPSRGESAELPQPALRLKTPAIPAAPAIPEPSPDDLDRLEAEMRARGELMPDFLS